jgi:hypothetical protein
MYEHSPTVYNVLLALKDDDCLWQSLAKSSFSSHPKCKRGNHPCSLYSGSGLDFTMSSLPS